MKRLLFFAVFFPTYLFGQIIVDNMEYNNKNDWVVVIRNIDTVGYFVSFELETSRDSLWYLIDENVLADSFSKMKTWIELKPSMVKTLHINIDKILKKVSVEIPDYLCLKHTLSQNNEEKYRVKVVYTPALDKNAQVLYSPVIHHGAIHN